MSHRTLVLWIVVLLASGFVTSVSVMAASQIDVYHFDSDEQQRRYRALIDEFRCPKCLNTNISGSDAPIAQDLRRTVHKLVVIDGLSDQEVRDYLQTRYGDFVLYDTPFNERTWLVWVVPIGLLGVGLTVLFAWSRRSKRIDEDLPDIDEATLEEILGSSQGVSVQDNSSQSP